MNITDTLNSIQDYLKKGARFASFLYHSKDSGEIAIFTVLLGINIDNAYRRDLKIVEEIPVTTPAQKQAKEETIKSLKNSLLRHSQNLSNDNYKLKGLYVKLTKGVRFNQNTGDILLDGFLINKEVIKPGEFKPVKSSEKTLAKKTFAKKMKCRRFRNFILSEKNIAGVKFNGRVLQIQPSTSLLNELNNKGKKSYVFGNA